MSSDNPTISLRSAQLYCRLRIDLWLQGIIPEEKVDGFNFPYYSPCAQEVELEIQQDGSFLIDQLEAFEIDWDGGVELWNTVDQTLSKGQRMAKTIRVVAEPILESCFGIDIMMTYFRGMGGLWPITCLRREPCS
ncbi:Jasmonate O-methyltransferase [Morella rubra]|uniref:Jasmonate O-methyltransferase n=1 Tax=Morella rubra TaxID=262757 RepID=A0A6A1UGL0_9ROSI|nr:Jasmonate O-methyltransferase [Morella rubra]